jgi:beta-1,2-mannosidase
MKKYILIFATLFCVLAISVTFSLEKENPGWLLGPFRKMDEVNPILKPNAETTFQCPVSGKTVCWEALYVYNPAAIVKDGKVFLLYRAQGTADDKFSLASRIGLAWSEDGAHFTRMDRPVLYPDNDFMKRYEWPGGCEDPRVVQDESGAYFLTYTAFDGKIARLCVASSKDLVHWTKHGPVFAKALGGKYLNRWSKSGAIVTAFKDGRQVATKIKGKYWMYWGDSDIFIAHSENLVDWTPVENDKAAMSGGDFFKQIGSLRLRRLIAVRDGYFDSGLVEPGPPPVLTRDGIVFIYNSKNRDYPGLPKAAYSAGQALIDPSDPGKVLARTDSNFIRPENELEKTGQVPNVVFLEGMVRFQEKNFIYYGTADTDIAVAVSR